MSKRKAAEDTGRIQANRNFHLVEAFFGSFDPFKLGIDKTTSMNDLAPALLKAKGLEEVVAICREIGVNEWSFGRDGTAIVLAIEFWRRNKVIPDDPLPFLAKWLFLTTQTVAASLDLYTVCLQVIRDKSNRSAVTNILNMLCVAENVSRQMQYEVDEKRLMAGRFSTDCEPLIVDYCGIPRFPLLSIFRNLQREHGEYMHRKYGIDYHQTKQGNQFQYHYWENAAAERELKDLLWSYAANDHTDDRKILLKCNDRVLAERILSLLDKHTELRMSDKINIKINSVTGETNVITCHVDTALFLWLVTKIRNTQDCRRCKICGQLFKVGSQKTRLYCDSHNKAAIDYFNRKLRKKARESENL